MNPETAPISTPYQDPHEYDHSHPDISGGWLRASVFGGMDGLVTNIGLIAGVGAAGASPGQIILTGVAGMVAGATSMALGEYTSVRTANEQIDAEAQVEREAQQRNPVGERRELTKMFLDLGMTLETARQAAREVHLDSERAVRVHLTQELGIDPTSKPSPLIAAVSSFVFFSVGSLIPLIPYFFGAASLWLGLAVGGVGLLVAGGVAAIFTRKNWLRGAIRQLLLGGLAVSLSYLIGTLLGVSVS